MTPLFGTKGREKLPTGFDRDGAEAAGGSPAATRFDGIPVGLKDLEEILPVRGIEHLVRPGDTNLNARHQGRASRRSMVSASAFGSRMKRRDAPSGLTEIPTTMALSIGTGDGSPTSCTIRSDRSGSCPTR